MPLPKAYMFQADLYCPSCTIEEVGAKYNVIPDHDQDAEEFLDFVADQEGFDRHDERLFDSGDFPKVVYNSEDLYYHDEEYDDYIPLGCGGCFTDLV